jgi:hypothetical protein
MNETAGAPCMIHAVAAVNATLIHSIETLDVSAALHGLDSASRGGKAGIRQ